MFTLIFCIILGVSVLALCKEIFPIAIRVIFGLLFGMLLGMFLQHCIYNSTNSWVTTNQTSLVAFRGEPGIEGAFVLGSGSLGPEYVYYCYATIATDSYRVLTLKGHNIVIIEEDRSDGLLTTLTRVSPHTRLVINELFINDEPNKKYEIHIPRGSLKTAYKP